MADLIVTFGRKDEEGALELAGGARSEAVVIDGTKRTSTLTAGGGDSVLTLFAEADCWVSVAVTADGPDAENANKRRFLAADAMRRFGCKSGDVVSVIAKV